jgi:hypothetical protein
MRQRILPARSMRRPMPPASLSIDSVLALDEIRTMDSRQ